MPVHARSRIVAACQQLLAVALVAVLALLAAGVGELRIAPPGTPSAGAPSAGAASATTVSMAPVEPEVRAVSLGRVSAERFQGGTPADAARANRMRSGREPVSGYATVGVTWSPRPGLNSSQVRVEVRTRDAGVWTAWEHLDYDDEHAPDPEEGSRRDGTEPMVIGDVDRVQVRATSTTRRPLDAVALQIVDPGEDRAPTRQEPAIDTGRSLLSSTDGSTSLERTASVRASQPTIYSRAQWGADERLRDPRSLRFGEVHAGFVHHTVNANDYSESQVPGIIRGIYAYHTRSLGWSDIGYNFLVDRFGNIWEGRYGGVDRPVVGAHTYGYNEVSFAMSAIGNFETARPTRAMLRAYGRLFGWKLGLHGVAADDRNQTLKGKTFQAVNGHRDAGSTACPGRYLYEKLPRIRTLATEAQDAGGSTSPEDPESAPADGTPLRPNLSGKAWPDLVVRDRATRHALIVRTAGQLAFARGWTATGWGGTRMLAQVGDLDEDGADEVLSARAGSTDVQRHEVVGDRLVALGTMPRLRGLDQVTGVGDLDGDGHRDVVGRRSHRLLLFAGTGGGGVRKAAVLAEDWSAFDLTTGVGDVDGDGYGDLVAREGDALVLARGSGPAPALRTPRTLPGRWTQYDTITGAGDVTGDGVPDLLARVAQDGRTYIHPGDGAGGWSARLGGWRSLRTLQHVSGSGDLGRNGRPDLVGVSPTGVLTTHLHTGRRNIDRIIDTGVRLEGIDLLLNVGDWDGDGRGDVMTRDAATGDLHLRRGRSGNTFAAPVVAARAWGGVTGLAAVGDVTGDDHPDLVGRDATSRERVFPGDGGTGFGAPVARTEVTATERVGLGWWDGDRTVDLGLRRADGTLWLQPGDGSAARQLLDRLRRYDWVRGLGDLDGDKRPDLVVRAQRTGHLFLLPGRRNGFAPRRLVAPGFHAYDFGA